MAKELRPIIQVIEEAYEIPQLGRTRRIAALLPHDYEEVETHYPVLFLHDGQNLYNKDAPYGSWAVDEALAELAKEGKKNVIIIAIDHGDETRVMEYSPYFNPKFGEGQGELYLEFLMDKLIPYVGKKFRVLEGREHLGIGGSSMGGLISLYAGITYPETFGKLMIFSPSLWISPKLFFHTSNYSATLPTDMYVYAGEKESKNHISNINRLKSSIFIAENNHSMLRFKLSINAKGTHSEVYWGKEFPKALKWLFFNNN